MGKRLMNLILGLLAITLAACSSQAQNKAGAARENSLSPVKTDSLDLSKTELAQVYTQAIAEYIAAVYQKDSTRFDALYFGRHVDFPDIDLPKSINGIKIFLLASEEIEAKKAGYSKTSPYINLAGFAERDKAEFIFFTFYPGFEHQFDGYVDLNYNSSKKEFELTSSRIEMLVRDKTGKANHYAIYQEGKHVGDKPIKGNHK